MGITRIIKSAVIHIGEKGALGSSIYHRIKYTAAKAIGLILGEEKYAKWFYHLYTGKSSRFRSC